MLNIADATKTPAASPQTAAGTATLGGDAWVMPTEPTGHAWVGAAPSIRIIDQRPAALFARAR